jgi:hypothetical protein
MMVQFLNDLGQGQTYAIIEVLKFLGCALVPVALIWFWGA